MDERTFSVISLGCFRNTYDSEILANRFRNKGYVFLSNSVLFKALEKKSAKKRSNEKSIKCINGESFPGIKGRSCDLLIINTCGFIDKAKEESLEIIKQAVELKKRKVVKEIMVLGCLVERYKLELGKFFPQIDQWQGVEEFSDSFSKRFRLSSSYSDFLKICEGCLNRCSFCAIPLIKGTLHSKPREEVIREVKHLDKNGIKELNIIGQDITSWGKDFRKKEDFTGLLKQILKETRNIKWIRLIYTHPRHFSNSLIELVANEERICKYIDLPIQHINDRILKLMNRNITRQEIINLIQKIRKMVPDCTIRTSVIVGFPTESEEEFKELLDFIEHTKFERLGAFIYSREENTPAHDFSPQIHHNTKKRRFKEVMELQRKVSQQINNRFINKEVEVFIERKEDGMFIGRTQYDAIDVDGITFVKKKGLKIGDFYKAKVIDAYEYDLVAV